MKSKFFLFVVMSIFSMVISFFSGDKNNRNAEAKTKEEASDFYQFSFKNFDGTDLKLSKFKGKVLLVVNTASKCGFTKQYAGLEKLHKKYQDQGLVVIAIPSADFGGQEFEQDEEIQHFCKYNFGVSFPVSRKEIVSGNKAHPFYKEAKQILGFGSTPKWNFHKYLINRKGQLVKHFNSYTSPEDEKFIKTIEELLK